MNTCGREERFPLALRGDEVLNERMRPACCLGQDPARRLPPWLQGISPQPGNKKAPLSHRTGSVEMGRRLGEWSPATPAKIQQVVPGVWAWIWADLRDTTSVSKPGTQPGSTKAVTEEELSLPYVFFPEGRQEVPCRPDLHSSLARPGLYIPPPINMENRIRLPGADHLRSVPLW